MTGASLTGVTDGETVTAELVSGPSDACNVNSGNEPLLTSATPADVRTTRLERADDDWKLSIPQDSSCKRPSLRVEPIFKFNSSIPEGVVNEIANF